MNICVCCNFTAAVKNAYYFCCLKCYPNELDLLYRSLEQLDQVFLDTVKQKVTSCVEGANNQQMKEIRQGSVIIFHHIVRILHYIVRILHHIVRMLHHIVQILHHIVQILHHIVKILYSTSYCQNIISYNQILYSQNITSYCQNITSYV